MDLLLNMHMCLLKLHVLLIPRKIVTQNIVIVGNILIVNVIQNAKHTAKQKNIIIEYVLLLITVCKSKEYKNALKKQFIEYQKSFISKLRGLRTSDPKSYWSLLNRGKATQQKVAMNVFFDHFKNMNNVENDIDIELPGNITEYNTVINEAISEKEVMGAIKSLNTGNDKACSKD